MNKSRIKNALINHKYLYKTVRFAYDITWKKYKISKKRNNFLSGFDGALSEIDANFSDHKIEFWAMFGTLLGLHRDGGPIKHDLDIDIGVWIEDRSKIRNLLTQKGYVMLHSFSSPSYADAIEDSFEINGVKVDFFYCKKREDNIVCYDFPDVDKSGNQLPDQHFSVRRIILPLSGFKVHLYKNNQLRIPLNTNEHLACRYGVDFMVPNPKYDYRKKSDCVEFLSDDGYITTM
ncbi:MULTISPECIES: LicD family protein [Vibrio]|uniref:LicD family protein n=1 Tax=Vibrio TaxID=662 RepID=UPI000C82700E|nr:MULTISPECIES: LicD family protein [Vibrio]PMH18490.1 hypothetical protein BCU77_21890 [Vibrio splendidus]PMI23373.1 hypothetical protein BCU50_06520 [Vibrio sp. 10N.286.46.E10]